ncbi:hypothetical protein Tco_0173536 [Tanacetum coccineum]
MKEQMKNYNAAKEDGSGEDGSAFEDHFLAVINKEYNGHRRLFGRGVTNKLIKKVNGSETSYMVPGELMEFVRTDIDAKLNRLVEIRKQIKDDHERKKLEIAEEHKRNKAELEDMRNEIEDQRDKLVEVFVYSKCVVIPNVASFGMVKATRILSRNQEFVFAAMAGRCLCYHGGAGLLCLQP